MSGYCPSSTGPYTITVNAAMMNHEYARTTLIPAMRPSDMPSLRPLATFGSLPPAGSVKAVAPECCIFQADVPYSEFAAPGHQLLQVGHGAAFEGVPGGPGRIVR
ncbi:hypothetical protein D9M72_512130 [compost metagenome]